MIRVYQLKKPLVQIKALPKAFDTNTLYKYDFVQKALPKALFVKKFIFCFFI